MLDIPTPLVDVFSSALTPMDDGAPSEFEGIAAAFAKAKQQREQEEAQGLRGTSDDAKAVNKTRELQFKASHGLLIAFFSWVL